MSLSLRVPLSSAENAIRADFLSRLRIAIRVVDRSRDCWIAALTVIVGVIVSIGETLLPEDAPTGVCL